EGAPQRTRYPATEVRGAADGSRHHYIAATVYRHPVAEISAGAPEAMRPGRTTARGCCADRDKSRVRPLRAPVVRHGEGRPERARRRVGVRYGRTGARTSVAEVPAVRGNRTIGVGGARVVERHRGSG